MRVRECFFGKSTHWSDVVLKKMLYFLVLIVVFGNLPSTCRAQNDRESRKLFGGYRITPTYCKASRAAKYNRGNTICMFNHECIQRGGEVVGTCMDGFLFGACCQLKSDSQSHFPKGPGIVMTSYLDYPDPELETADYEADQLNVWHNSFKPIVTPGYKPSSSSTTPDNLSTEAEIINEGVNQIANTLLNEPPKEGELIYVKPKPDYTHSSIDHGPADTILVHTNGTIVDTVVRPSDFNVQISAMQTKPTAAPSTTTTTQKTISTHRPIKPVFKPKPIKATTENYIIVSTVTKESQKPEVSSIDSIIQMLNDSTPSVKEEVTSPGYLDVMETKSSPAPATLSPIFSSTFNYYPSTGHYVTLKPSSIPTKKPYTTKKPVYDYVYTTANVDKYSSPIPASQYTSQAIEAFNKYPTDPADFDNSVTTFSYVSSTTTPNPAPTRRPPSTSYITGAPNPLRRPVTPPSPIVSSYDVPLESFSSVTPTVIVLHNFPPKPSTSTEQSEPQFVEISQEPFKKPVSQITVNNHIASTNNIYVGKPPPQHIRPSSPTVLITPKPAPVTTPYPIKTSERPASSSSSRPVETRPWPSSSPKPVENRPWISSTTKPPSSRPVETRPWVSSTTRPTETRPWSTRPTVSTTQFFDYTEYSPTTFRPEQQTSPDDLINFPPVRNPLLNATGSNPAFYNTSISISDNELSDSDLLHEIQFTTPTWQEDEQLKEKMSVFVSKIVGSLQGTFQELHDIVILDKKQNTTLKTTTTTARPKKTLPPKRPLTTRKPIRATTTTRRPPAKTTRKPVRLTTAARRTTTPVPTTTTAVITSTKKPATTTKKKSPVKKVTTTASPTSTTEVDEPTTETLADQSIDYNDKRLCGVRPLAKSGRIVGGKNARFGEYPWQALVRESTWLGLFTKNKCGGVLISSRYVTTAAHCQPGFLASLVAVFGENDISGDKEPKNPVSRNVRRVIVHREYDAATFENDLALLELDTPIKFDAHIVPICMPPDEADFTGRMATVTGWGRLKYGGGVPAVLQEVQVPVIENSACQDMFQTAGHDKKILNSFICAGYANGQKDSCEGDSGGPLVLQRDDGRWQLVGTVSHGIKCAAPFLPGVYMRTTFYKPWLKTITGVQ